MKKIILTDIKPSLNPNTEELAKIFIERIGLMPRKKGSTEKIHRILLELYERTKSSIKEKKPELAVMSVEEMSIFAGITRQTMYEYLRRWLDINIIIKTSYIRDTKVVIGYKLNGNNIENAFQKVKQEVINNLEDTEEYIKELQKQIKNEKIRQKRLDEIFKSNT